jgi:hypothetical protein
MCSFTSTVHMIRRFPATVQNVFSFLYLQVQHLDLDFDDHYFKPGAYLTTHKEHMKKWH